MRALFQGVLLGGLALGALTACGGSSLTLDSGDPAQGGASNPVTPGGQDPGGQDTGDTDVGGGQDTGFWPTDSGMGQNPGQQPGGQNPGGQNPGGQPPAEDSGLSFGQDSGLSFGQDSGQDQDSGCNTGQPGGSNPGGQSPGGQSPGAGACTQTLEPGAPGILDCDGTCAPQTWIGDSVCDDGTYGANFQCAQHQQDGGDC